MQVCTKSDVVQEDEEEADGPGDVAVPDGEEDCGIIAVSWEVFGFEEEEGPELVDGEGGQEDDGPEEVAQLVDGVGDYQDAWAYYCLHYCYSSQHEILVGPSLLALLVPMELANMLCSPFSSPLSYYGFRSSS